MSNFLPISLAPNLIGHEKSEKHFLKLHASNRLHHGWLLNGPKGIGKGALAIRMARIILGGGSSDMFGGMSMDFEEHDVFIHRLANGGHPDFMYLYLGLPNLKQKDKQCTDIPIDYIRSAKEFLHKTSGESNCKVLIIDDADSINVNGANALLKILEEPHPHTYIILVTSKPNTLLPTIRSRCSVLTLQALKLKQLEDILQKKFPKLDASEIKAYSKMSDGSIGKAISYVNNNVLPLYIQMIDAMAKDSLGVYALVSSVTGKANENKYAILSDMIHGWLGRLAISFVKQDGMNQVVSHEQKAYDKITAKFSKLDLLDWITMVKKNIDSVNPPRYMDKKTVILTTFLPLHDGL